MSVQPTETPAVVFISYHYPPSNAIGARRNGAVVRWGDVEVDASNDTIKTRKAMEAAFSSKV